MQQALFLMFFRPWNELGINGCWEARGSASSPGQVISHAHITNCGSEGRIAKIYLASVYNRTNWTLAQQYHRHKSEVRSLKPDPLSQQVTRSYARIK